MRIKKGVSVVGMQPEMILAHLICDGIYKKYGLDYVLTSGREGDHKKGSLHYVGLASDTRNRDIPLAQRKNIRDELQHALQEEYTVILEGTHFHVEFQPQTGVPE